MGCLGSEPAKPRLPVNPPPQQPPKDSYNFKLHPVEPPPTDPLHPHTPKKVASQLNPNQIVDPAQQSQQHPNPYTAQHPSDIKPPSDLKNASHIPASDIKHPSNIPASGIKPNSNINHQSGEGIRQSDIKVGEQMLASPGPGQNLSGIVQQMPSNISEGGHAERHLERNLKSQLEKIEQEDLVHSEGATNFTPPVRNINFHIQMT